MSEIRRGRSPDAHVYARLRRGLGLAARPSTRSSGRVQSPSTDPPSPFKTLDELERDHLREVLTYTNGNVSHAARLLGIYRSSLQRKLRKRGMAVW